MNIKNIIALIGLGLCVQAEAASLSTTDGTTYDHITTQRIDPDGLYIEYTPPGGGIGMSKVKFSRLSEDQQRQFGYDADKAKAHTAQVAKANAEFRDESIRWEQLAQAQRVVRQQRELEEEKIQTEKLMALAQLNPAQASAPASENYGGWSGGGDLFGIPTSGRVPEAKTVFAPIVRPVPFPVINTPHQRFK